MNPHAKIVECLGGPAELARLLGVRSNTVGKWKIRGIPPDYWLKVCALQPGLTEECLARTKPTPTSSSSRRHLVAAE